MYEAFYGLTGKPFQLNPDPAFFFGSRGHTRAFAYLQYGLYQSEGFIVITGEVGAGKTTIVRSLLEQLDPEKVVAAQIVTTQLDADDLLRSVAAAFGFPPAANGKAELLGNLEAFLCRLVPQRKRALLVVDEAQNLTPRAVEELRMLSNFQLGDHALLQSFLIGQPELRQVLQGGQMQQLRQRVHRLLSPRPARPDRDASLHRASPEARRLEGRPELRAGGVRGDPRRLRRHPAADQHVVQPRAAGGLSRRKGTPFARRRRDGRGERDSEGAWPRDRHIAGRIGHGRRARPTAGLSGARSVS